MRLKIVGKGKKKRILINERWDKTFCYLFYTMLKEHSEKVDKKEYDILREEVMEIDRKEELLKVWRMYLKELVPLLSKTRENRCKIHCLFGNVLELHIELWHKYPSFLSPCVKSMITQLEDLKPLLKTGSTIEYY